MENSKGALVRRGREGDKDTPTAMDMVQSRVNKGTRGTEAVVYVQDEINRKVIMQQTVSIWWRIDTRCNSGYEYYSTLLR